jgi:hypothetical protein
LKIPNSISQTEIAFGASTLKGRAIPAAIAHTAAVRMGSQVITLQNAVFVPEVGLLRDAGLPECYVPANAWTSGPAHELVALMGGTTFDASKIAPVISRELRKAVNDKCRDLFTTNWWGDKDGNSPEKLARQEAALREMMRPSVAHSMIVASKAATPAPETVATPAPAETLESLLGLAATPAPVQEVAAPAPETVSPEEQLMNLLTQGTTAAPVAVDEGITKDEMVARVMEATGMSKSSAERQPAAVLMSILGL